MMAFVVEQGVGGLGQGVISPLGRGDKSQVDATAPEHQGGT